MLASPMGRTSVAPEEGQAASPGTGHSQKKVP